MNLTYPELICLNEYGGDFGSYFSAIYSVFENDFIRSQPIYEKLRVSVKRYPEVDKMHKTFYHITHEGADEDNRSPDIRRMERIRFPKFVIDNYQHDNILIWRNTRGRNECVLLFDESESYIVVLTDRKDYYLFTTAYCVEREHTKAKLLKEYATYKKAKTV